MTSSALVMIMAPGVGFLCASRFHPVVFYLEIDPFLSADSGLLRRKNALSMMFLSMAVYSLITIEWWVSPLLSLVILAHSSFSAGSSGATPSPSRALVPSSVTSRTSVS